MKRLVLICLLAALAGAPAAFAGRSTAGMTSIQALDSDVLARLNAIRAAHGLVPLKPNPALSAAAQRHSEEMLADGYFAHESFSGAAFWKRLAGYTGPTPYGWSAGENLIWSSPGLDASAALRTWMASPEHRQNILRSTWREIGIAAVHAASAPGTYGGQPVTVITADFGVRH